ncbi:MAG: molybdopterin-dependent oxidoreductase Mo/Fe-S-binding subunit [Spirochaetia bacterium]|jgi:putative selenate reductase molybdopterin-binding subunit|nr:molybdopterin-dependent oxidoreductase Mo/Fe-S-binding subunit [Spirochaetia bacterium]
MKINFKLNDRNVSWECEPGETLRSALRRKGIISVRDGCDGEGSCGLCAVLLDGRLVNSCQILAPQVEGSKVITVEWYSRDRKLSIVQQALIDASCVQCGYCTPAVVLALHDLLERSPKPSDEELRDALSGTLCRCTGYEQFYDAANIASKRLADPSYMPPLGPEFRPDLRHVGKDREKVDAPALARGEKAFVEDRVDADACHLKLMMSPHAHAWIKSIDVSKALQMPGVVDIVTHENCPDSVYTTAGQGFPEPSPYDQRMFPRKVRHVGDRVAAVLAETPEEAEAAIKAIVVTYEVLKPVLSIAEAKASGAPIIHHGDVSYVVGEAPAGSSVKGDGRDDPIIYQFPLHADPHRNLAASVADGIGDCDKGFAEADVVVERTYVGKRVQCTPMEPHVVYAKVDGDRLVIHASTQVPWHLRRIVASAIGISENKVRVIKERVGGGFGAKQDIVLEDVAGFMAWKTRRPVLFRYDRAMEFMTSRTRHGMEITVKLGAKRDGTLTAMDMRVEADTGPYGQHCLTVPMNAVSKSLPLILCDNARFSVMTYYTNLSPAGAYQGYGAPKGSFALQGTLAELAAELGMDQLDLIEKNRVRSGSRIEILRSLGEGRPGSPVTLGECGLGEMIARGRKAFAWDKPKPESDDPDWKIGRGAVIIQQGSGLPGLDAANAELRLLPDGSLLMLSGGADLGTGLDTVTAKAAAEIMGLDMDMVSVVSGDTDTTPFDKGAYASSGTYFSGNAAVRAAEDLRDKCFTVASGILGEPFENFTIHAGGIIKGKQGEISLAKLAHMSTQGEGHGDLIGFGTFKTDHAAFPYGAHFVEAAVNVRTGDVKLKRFHAYQDCGTPINPALAIGQIYGGVMKAVGHSLYEECLFDDKGQPLNLGFTDYKIPSIYEVPDDFHVELVPVADEIGPFGGKSVSEISLNSAAPAISIAIHDAVGAWCRVWPFTPERILRAMGKL